MQLVFGDAPSVEHVNLEIALKKLQAIHAANQLCHSLMLAVPPSLPARLASLSSLAALQNAIRVLSEHEHVAQLAFASAWQGIASDWSTLRNAAHWITANPDLTHLASKTPNPTALADRCIQAADDAIQTLNRLDALFNALLFNPVPAFGAFTAHAPISALISHLQRWRATQEDLSLWVAYCSCAHSAHTLGLSEYADALHTGRLRPSDALRTFEMSYYEALFLDQIRQHPALAQFDGALQDKRVLSFADLDLQRIAVSSVEVVQAHHQRIPPTAGASVGPLGTLRAEIARKRGHKPIRQLMQLASPPIQALKPVFMMSPLSVAQFLPPGLLRFDLLVMDEASQIQPVDALGAVARCRQVVVVGDPQQLPPTAFFSKMTGGSDDEDEDDTARVADIESILGLFSARGLPKKMLRWHYRSRHPSLIAVSNRQFYDNKLFIAPSPFLAEYGMGLRFHHIPNGLFETGSTRTNPVEAKAVANAIIAHALEYPHFSLGVVSFSVAHRRAIQDQLEILRRQLNPAQEAFFQSHPSEPFFIKNLENVQGDERDIIFISVGYGPSTPGGKPSMRFGPLGAEGGERRLNVLISRAKRRCDVFASMTDDDISSDFASTRKGVFAFKMFLHYARTGRLAFAEAASSDFEGVFERHVSDVLQARGYQVHQNVGIAGFFVDLAVLDPKNPERYILGIECDGASYHSAHSARDRERLRHAILEDHGWIVHRIWSMDWFQRPKDQLERLVARIEAAKLQLLERTQHAHLPRPAAVSAPVVIARSEVTEPERVEDQAAVKVFYLESMLTRPSHLYEDLHQLHASALAILVVEIVAVEGPVHLQEVVSRLRDAWGLKRAGARIQDAVMGAVVAAARAGLVAVDGLFLSIPGVTPQVRDRSQTLSASLRKPETIPPAEVRQAILELVRANFGASADQIIQSVSRAMGFKSTSNPLREVIQGVLDGMIHQGSLVQQGAILIVMDGVH